MKILFIILISLLIIIVSFFIIALIFKKRDQNKTVEDIITFIKENPNKCSITFIENGEKIIDLNAEKKVPLASTFKIILAISCIFALRNKEINLGEEVNIIDVDKFYFKNTDGNAHLDWKNNEKIGSVITIKQIIQGMMKYSSNACTEYLYNKIGQSNIGSVIKHFELNKHSIIYPVNSAMLIPPYFYHEENMKKKDILKRMKNISEQEYYSLSKRILDKIVHNNVSSLVDKLNIISDIGIQKEFTKRLPSATTSDYAKLMYNIGATNALNEEEKLLLDEIMGSLPTNDESRLWYKGGSTIFVLTSAIYKNDINTNFSFSFFIEDFSRLDILWIRNVYLDFLRCFTNSIQFREKVISELESAGLLTKNL